MEDLERYLNCLQTTYTTAIRLEKLLAEGRDDPKLGMSGEAAALYRKYCGKAIDKVQEMQKKITVLISESSAGLI